MLMGPIKGSLGTKKERHVHRLAFSTISESSSSLLVKWTLCASSTRSFSPRCFQFSNPCSIFLFFRLAPTSTGPIGDEASGGRTRKNPFDRSLTSSSVPPRPRVVAVARPLVKLDQTSSTSRDLPKTTTVRTIGVVEPRVVVKIPWARVKDLPSNLEHHHPDESDDCNGQKKKKHSPRKTLIEGTLTHGKELGEGKNGTPVKSDIFQKRATHNRIETTGIEGNQGIGTKSNKSQTHEHPNKRTNTSSEEGTGNNTFRNNAGTNRKRREIREDANGTKRTRLDKTFQLTAELPEHFKLALQERLHVVPKELLNVYLENEVREQQDVVDGAIRKQVETKNTKLRQGPRIRCSRDQRKRNSKPRNTPPVNGTHQNDMKRKRTRSSSPSSSSSSSSEFECPNDEMGIKINPLKLIRRYVPGTKNEEYKIEPGMKQEDLVDLVSDDETTDLNEDFFKERVPHLKVTKAVQTAPLRDMRVLVKKLTEQDISEFIAKKQEISDNDASLSEDDATIGPRDQDDFQDEDSNNSCDSLSSYDEADLPQWKGNEPMRGFDDLSSSSLSSSSSGNTLTKLPREQKSVNSSRESRFEKHFHQYRATAKEALVMSLPSKPSAETRSISRGVPTPTFGVVPPPQTWSERVPFTSRPTTILNSYSNPGTLSALKKDDVNTVANTLHTLLKLDDGRKSPLVKEPERVSPSSTSKRDIEGKGTSDKERAHLNSAPIPDKEEANGVQNQPLLLDSPSFMEAPNTPSSSSEPTLSEELNDYGGAISSGGMNVTTTTTIITQATPSLNESFMESLQDSNATTSHQNYADLFDKALETFDPVNAHDLSDLTSTLHSSNHPPSSAALPIATNVTSVGGDNNNKHHLSMPVLFQDDNSSAIQDLSSILAYPSTIDLNQLDSGNATTSSIPHPSNPITTTATTISTSTSTNSSTTGNVESTPSEINHNHPSGDNNSSAVTSPSSDKENERNTENPHQKNSIQQQDVGKSSADDDALGKNNGDESDDDIVCLTPLQNHTTNANSSQNNGPLNSGPSKTEPNRGGRPRRYYKSIDELEQKAVMMLQKKNHNLMNMSHDAIIASIKAELTSANDPSISSQRRKAEFNDQPIEDSKWLYCDRVKCNFWTRKERRMERHRQSHMPDCRAFKCPDCGVRFYSLPKMLSHDRKFHTGDKDYECKICEAEVTDISVHMRVSWRRRWRWWWWQLTNKSIASVRIFKRHMNEPRSFDESAAVDRASFVMHIKEAKEQILMFLSSHGPFFKSISNRPFFVLCFRFTEQRKISLAIFAHCRSVTRTLWFDIWSSIRGKDHSDVSTVMHRLPWWQRSETMSRRSTRTCPSISMSVEELEGHSSDQEGSAPRTDLSFQLPPRVKSFRHQFSPGPQIRVMPGSCPILIRARHSRRLDPLDQSPS